MNNATCPAVFSKTLEKTMHWITSLNTVMGTDNDQSAYMTLRAVLHALRDRVTPEEAIQLSAQLPMLIRGFFFDGWHPADKPKHYRHREDFLAQVKRENPRLAENDLEHAVTSVFVVMSAELHGGELDQVRQMLPPEVRELWPVSAM